MAPKEVKAKAQAEAQAETKQLKPVKPTQCEGEGEGQSSGVVMAQPEEPTPVEPTPVEQTEEPTPEEPSLKKARLAVSDRYLSPEEDALIEPLPQEIKDCKRWSPTAFAGSWPTEAQLQIAQEPRGCLAFMIKTVEQAFSAHTGRAAALLAPLKLTNLDDHAWTGEWTNKAALQSLRDDAAENEAQYAINGFGLDFLAGKDDPDLGNVLENSEFFFKQPRHCHLLHGHLDSLAVLEDAPGDELPPKCIELSGVGAKCHAWSLVVGTFNTISSDADPVLKLNLIKQWLQVWRSIVVCCRSYAKRGDVRKTEIKQAEAIDKQAKTQTLTALDKARIVAGIEDDIGTTTGKRATLPAVSAWMEDIS